MQDRYYLNNMSNAEVTINLSTRRVIKPFTSLPLNNKDVMIFKEMKAKRKDRISRFDSLKLSRIPLTEDSNFAVKAIVEEAEEIKKAAKEEKPEVTPEVKPEEKPEVTPEEKPEVKPEEKPESKAEEKPEPKVEENKKSKKEKAEEDARKALEANLNEQYI